MKQSFVSAKIGTIPSPGVWIRSKPVVGKPICFREFGSRKWETGLVDKVVDLSGSPFLFISW